MNLLKLFVQDMHDLWFMLKVACGKATDSSSPMCDLEQHGYLHSSMRQIAIDAIYDELRSFKRIDLQQDHQPDEIEEQLLAYEPQLRLKAKMIYWSQKDPALDDIVSVAKHKRQLAGNRSLVDDYERLDMHTKYQDWFTQRIVGYMLVATIAIVAILATILRRSEKK